MNRIRKIAVPFLTVLLFVLSALPVFAAEEALAVYDTYYDETAGELSVYVDIVNAERGDLDLLPAMRDAAASGACVDIDAGPVKLYFHADTVKKFAAYEGGELLLLIKETSLKEEETAETNETEERGETDLPQELRYRISLGDNNTEFDYGSVRIRFRYTATLSSAVRVFTVYENGNRSELRSVCEEGLVSFYPKELGEFAVNEEPEEGGIPKIVSIALLGVLVMAVGSIVLLILLKKGTLKKLYQRNHT